MQLLALALSVGQYAAMSFETTRVQRGNRTYEYLSFVEAFRGDDGKKRHNTLFRLGEASALRETGELDRIIAALQAHAECRYADIDDASLRVGACSGGR